MERGFEPHERAYGGLLRAEGRERDERLQRDREREWERRDRERGDPPGTARARDEADRDDWCP